MKLIKKNKSPFYAVSCLFQGFAMLTKPELRKYLLIPILINLILYSIAFALGYFYISDLITEFIPDWLSWLEWLIWPMFFICFSIAGFFTFTILANLIASPFYSKLSIKTTEVISGQILDVKEQAVSQNFLAKFNRLGYLVSRMVLLLILFLIPVVNIAAPFLWLLFSAWWMGLEFMAYPLENQGLLFVEQKEQAKTRRIAVICFGGLTVIGLTIPFVNLIVAPAAVIGATIYTKD